MSIAQRRALDRRRRPAWGLVCLVVLAPGWASAGAVSDGKQVFDDHCAVCHSPIAEFHKEGPSLAGVYGRRAGTAPFFARYQGLRGADFVWTDQTLDSWLADPRGFLDGKNTSMTYRLTDPAARASVIAYLKSLR